jgi:hypothetical protein
VLSLGSARAPFLPRNHALNDGCASLELPTSTWDEWLGPLQEKANDRGRKVVIAAGLGWSGSESHGLTCMSLLTQRHPTALEQGALAAKDRLSAGSALGASPALSYGSSHCLHDSYFQFSSAAVCDDVGVVIPSYC